MKVSRIRPRDVGGIVLGALACALVSTMAASAVLAQGSSYAVANYAYAPADADATIPFCGSSTPSQSPTGYNCGPVPVGGGGLYIGSGYASAVAGQLRASTSGSAVLPGQGGATSIASSQWTDQAFVSPLGGNSTATQLQIALHLTGTLSSAGGDASDYQGASSMAVFRIPYGNSYVQYSWNNGAGAPNPTSGVDQVFLMTLALSNGATSRFQYGITTFALLTNSGADPVNPSLTGSAASDFSHTVNPLWYHVLDANNNDVTSDYQVQFAEGLSFGETPAPTTTPEPSAVALLATGLLTVVPRVRRKSS